MTHHIVLKIAYDGSSYFGWQKTKEGPSIEESLQCILERIFSQTISLRAASRTDRGVHANGQIVDFFCTSLPKDLQKIQVSLNQLLPTSIRCLSISHAPFPDFHPTCSAIGKQYSYYVTNAKVQKPIFRHTHWHIISELNLNLMKEATLLFIGTHDFKGFSNAHALLKENTIRTLHSLTITELSDTNELIFDIYGNNFLYKMVRNIVGTLLYIGMGKLDLSAIEKTFSSNDRTLAGITAPAHGLTLANVLYHL